MRKLFVALAMGLMLTSCLAMGDPGYEMEPVGMEKINQKQWVKTFDGFELQANSIGGLAGEWWIALYLTFSTGPKPVTIETVELQTAKGIYPGVVTEDFRVIPPRSNHTRLWITWEFDDHTPAPDILADSSRIVFHLKMGDREETAEIEYRRVRCC